MKLGLNCKFFLKENILSDWEENEREQTPYFNDSIPWVDPTWAPRRNSTDPYGCERQPPTAGQRSTQAFFCYPLKARGSLIFEATDDELTFRGRHFTFSLGSESLQKTGKFPKSMVSCQRTLKSTDGQWNEFLICLVLLQPSTQAFFHAPERKLMLLTLNKLSRVESPQRLGKRQIVNTQCPLWCATNSWTVVSVHELFCNQSSIAKQLMAAEKRISSWSFKNSFIEI